ncbi:MAG: hypothetical protein DMF76_14700, partial [Acidobacteria bacterium]
NNKTIFSLAYRGNESWKCFSGLCSYLMLLVRGLPICSAGRNITLRCGMSFQVMFDETSL